MKRSIVQARGAAHFPEFTGERFHMRAIFKGRPLPADISRWQGTVDAMLDGVDADGPLYLMVDQARVAAGTTHRRAGVHIDGHWIPAIQAHGGYTPEPYTGGHRMPSRPSGSHVNPMDVPRVTPGSHGMPEAPGALPSPTRSKPSRATIPKPPVQDPRDIPENLPPDVFAPLHEEGIILASSVTGCRGFDGFWMGEPQEGGDCSHIDLSGLVPVTMRRGAVYAGNVTMLHESLSMPFDCLRTVVRLNVPGWAP